VLDQRPGAGEPGRVAGLGEDGGGADRGQPGDAGRHAGQGELVEDRNHAGLDDGDLGAGVGQVGQHEPGPLQRAGALVGHTGRDPGRVGCGVCQSLDVAEFYGAQPRPVREAGHSLDAVQRFQLQ
jgi:hypothetical protein